MAVHAKLTAGLFALFMGGPVVGLSTVSLDFWSVLCQLLGICQ